MTAASDEKEALPVDERAEEQEPIESRVGYAVILALLLGNFVIHPWRELTIAGVQLVSLLLVVTMMVTLVAFVRSRIALILLVLLVAEVLLRSSVISGDALEYALRMGFSAIVAATILNRVRAHRTVTAHTVCGALSVYLLLGLFWAAGYQMIEHYEPGSFVGAATVDDPSSTAEQAAQGNIPSTDNSAFFYYSHVTMTTLGFGDIRPVTRVARSASTLQAVVGQFLLVVLVARLVGLMMQPGRER